MNVPNVISLARLFAVPVIVWLVLTGEMTVAFWVALTGAVSDAVDGAIAKYFDTETEFGAYLDPIADKALLVSTFVVLGHEEYLAMWLVILVVFRDLLIVGGAMLFHTVTQSLSMQPLLISKVNTFVQLLLAVVVLGDSGYDLRLDGAIMGLGYVVALTTFWSGAVYVVKWSERAAAHEEEGATAKEPE